MKRPFSFGLRSSGPVCKLSCVHFYSMTFTLLGDDAGSRQTPLTAKVDGMRLMYPSAYLDVG